MTNPSGGGPPFWSPDTDETLHAYNQFSWEICIDPIATETECDQLWPENSSLEYDFPQSTSDLSENSTRCQSGTTYNEALIYGDFFGAEVLDPLTLHPWDNLNCSLSLPDWDNLEDMASIPLQDNFSGSFLLPSSSEDSIEQTFQTISPELADIGAPWNPFRAIFNHGETQPYEAYSLFSNTRLPILENSSLNTTPCVGVFP